MRRRRRITEIINEQIGRWETNRRLEREVEPRTPPPVIALSNAYGSHGVEIGELVAKALEFDLFDRELVSRVAESAKVREMVVESLDQRTRSWIDEFIANLFDTQLLTATDYNRHRSQLLLALARHGRCVIIGRGAYRILDPRCTLRVRTIAPLEHRVRVVGQLLQLATTEARVAVLAKDGARAAYCRLHFNGVVGDPLDYDLVINTATLPAEQAAQLVVRAFRGRFVS